MAKKGSPSESSRETNLDNMYSLRKADSQTVVGEFCGRSFPTEVIEDLIGERIVVGWDYAAGLKIETPAPWPLGHSQYASAGDLAPVYKSALDVWEPLVGIAAEQMKVPPEVRELQARAHLLVLTHVSLIGIGYLVQQSGHRHQFNDMRAFANFHRAVLDEIGPFKAGRMIGSSLLGWGPNDINDYQSFVDRGGMELRERFCVIFDEMVAAYPEANVGRLFNVGVENLMRGFSKFVDLDEQRLFAIMEWPAQPDFSWSEFVVYDDCPNFTYFAKKHFEYFVTLLSPVLGEIEARLSAFASFFPAFDPPFSQEDCEVIDWLLESSLAWVQREKPDYFGESVTSIINSIKETNQITGIGPIPAVLENSARALLLQFRFPKRLTADLSQEMYKQICFGWLVIQNRHHFPTRKQWAELVTAANQLADDLTVRLCIAAKRRRVLEDGELLKQIQDLVGMGEIKQALSGYLATAKTASKPQQVALQHVVLTGNPGTGKTTVAKLLGDVFEVMGLLENGHVVYVTRADLVAQFTGQTAPKVAAKVEEALGGVLFIDEAYSLASGSGTDGDSFGREAIDELLVQMENNRGKFLVIAAGYPGEMERFLSSNPGLKSRFGTFWNIPDYSTEQLTQILEGFVHERGETLGADALPVFQQLATEARKQANFANGRWVRNVLDESMRRRALRLGQQPESAPEITAADLVSPVSKNGIDEQGLQLIQSEIRQMVSIPGIDEIVEEIIALQRMRIRRSESGLPDLAPPANNLLFLGPPGTGKTTLARLIGNVYKSLGVLRSGHLVECARADLVAGYVGQTALRTAEVFARARGGVLFIDEAYTLTEPSASSSGPDFGREAVETILKLMEDHREDTVVIAAGYPDKMGAFLASNPGLPSRFGRTINFPPWSAEQTLEVVSVSLESKSFELDERARLELQSICARLVASANFASGRTARSFVDAIIASQSVRVSGDNDASLTLILDSDVRNASTKLALTQTEISTRWHM